MNWKHLLVIALAALLSISACKSKTAKETPPAPPAPTEPAPTAPAAAPTEPAPTEPAPTEPAPTEPVAAPTEPAPTEPAAGGDPCEADVAKMIACASEGLPPEAVEATVAAMKDGMVQGCEAMKTAGQTDYISKAMEACKDTPCGAGGADWMTCHATKMAEIMMAEMGAAMP